MGEATRVGSRNFLMVGVHVAHNCEVGDDNVFANGAALAGHVVVEDHVFLSSNVGAHQFVRFGRYAMVVIMVSLILTAPTDPDRYLSSPRISEPL